MHDLYGEPYDDTYLRVWWSGCMLLPAVAGLQRTLRVHHRWLLRSVLVQSQVIPVVLGSSEQQRWG
jgi:hypothetical protein